MNNPLKRIKTKYNSHIEELISRIEYKSDEVIPVNFYSGIANWGDALNRVMIAEISGRRVIKSNGYGNHILGVGSVLHLANRNSIIIGSGFISEKKAKKISRAKKVISLRGQLSYQESGLKVDEIYGDLAVLTSLLYPKVKTYEFALGIVPHYVDYEEINLRFREDRTINVIDIRAGHNEFLNELNSCKMILSSSLHGLIAADSYNIPNVWIEPQGEIIGGKFKYIDYYTSTKSDSKRIQSYPLSNGIKALERCAKVHEFRFDKLEYLKEVKNAICAYYHND